MNASAAVSNPPFQDCIPSGVIWNPVPPDTLLKLTNLSSSIPSLTKSEEKKTSFVKTQPIAAKMDVESLDTLNFFLAKRKFNPERAICFLKWAQPVEEELCLNKINIVRSYPIKDLPGPYFKVYPSDYHVISEHNPASLYASRVTSGIIIGVIGFDQQNNRVVRGLLHYENDSQLMKKFLIKVKKKKACSIHVYAVSHYISENILPKELQAELEQSGIQFELKDALFNPFNVKPVEMQQVLNDKYHSDAFPDPTTHLKPCLDVLRAEFTMGITTNSEIFVFKKQISKAFEIDKIARIYLFCSAQAKDVVSLSKSCLNSPELREEVIQDLINILKYGSFSNRRTRINFFANIKCFINELQGPFVPDNIRITKVIKGLRNSESS